MAAEEIIILSDEDDETEASKKDCSIVPNGDSSSIPSKKQKLSQNGHQSDEANAQPSTTTKQTARKRMSSFTPKLHPTEVVDLVQDENTSNK